MYVYRLISIAVPVNRGDIGQAEKLADAIELLLRSGYVVFRGTPGPRRRGGKRQATR